jgi:hypothetical protein
VGAQGEWPHKAVSHAGTGTDRDAGTRAVRDAVPNPEAFTDAVRDAVPNPVADAVANPIADAVANPISDAVADAQSERPRLHHPVVNRLDLLDGRGARDQ